MSATATMRAMRVRVTPEMVREYQYCIEPLIKRIVEIEALRPPGILIHANGSIESLRGELPPALEAIIEQYKAAIEVVRKSIFGDAA